MEPSIENFTKAEAVEWAREHFDEEVATCFEPPK